MWKSLTKPLTCHTYHISNRTPVWDSARVTSPLQDACKKNTPDGWRYYRLHINSCHDATCLFLWPISIFFFFSKQVFVCLFLWHAIKDQKADLLRTFSEDAVHFRTQFRVRRCCASVCGGRKMQIWLIMQLCVRLSADYWSCRLGCWTRSPAAFTSLTFLMLAQAKPSQRAIQHDWTHAYALIHVTQKEMWNCG